MTNFSHYKLTSHYQACLELLQRQVELREAAEKIKSFGGSLSIDKNNSGDDKLRLDFGYGKEHGSLYAAKISKVLIDSADEELLELRTKLDMLRTDTSGSIKSIDDYLISAGIISVLESEQDE